MASQSRQQGNSLMKSDRMASNQPLPRRRRAMATLVAGGIALISSFPIPAAPTNSSTPSLLPPLAMGDEPIVVTEHRIQTEHGPLTYETRVGRLPIRNEETGEVRGRIFFCAYVVTSKGATRPLTFAWNGGPTSPSNLIHLELLGPRRRVGDRVVDNAQTLLTDSDLVFYDPVETGFSRPEKPEFAPEFLNMKGDVAATVEFIRAYRRRFGAARQPLIVAGESYGVFRGAAVVDRFTAEGEKVAAAILISGDIPNIPMPIPFYNAMHIPARTATAFYFHRLPAELQKDRDATLKEVNQWITSTYMPALEHVDQLNDAEREKIATDLARYIGLRPDQVNRKTLVVPVKYFLEGFFDGDRTANLMGIDARLTTKDHFDVGSPALVSRYYRDELGYMTDLSYSPLEPGYMPTPGPLRRPNYLQWIYNQDGITPEIIAAASAEGEVTLIAKNNPQWIPNAMKADKNLKVFVASGRYDPLNMCEGDAIATATLPPDLSKRITNHCYEGGHMMYRDEPTRLQMSHDLSEFVRGLE